MDHGIIAIDKPAGISSARVVARLKKALNVKKAGHTGTLDPFATGLLICGINKGTKLSRFLLGGEKKYTGVVHLGVETDTLDSTGTIVKQADPSVFDSLTEDLISRTVKAFIGPQKQNPPVYSALKHNGQPLYRLARQGQMVRKPTRDIEIFSIAISKIKLPFVTIDVHCSSGTYIRSLAHDIGKNLGCGGHLSALVRTYACGFSLDDAVSLTEVENMDNKTAFEHVIPLAEAVPFMPLVSVCDETIDKIKFGQRISAQDGIQPHADSFIRIVDKNGELAAVVEYDKISGRYNYCCVFIS